MKHQPPSKSFDSASVIDKNINNWHVMVVIQHLLDSGYNFDDLLFIPNISHRHESRLIHKVVKRDHQVTIFLNSFIFPYEIYSAILNDDLTTEFHLLKALLKIESLLLKKRYQLLFIESVGQLTNTPTDTLLARKTDFFANSPLELSDKITQILRAYGYVYGRLCEDIQPFMIQNNLLSQMSQLGSIEIGYYRHTQVKKIRLCVFLREEYAEQKLGVIKQLILTDINQVLDFNLEDLIVEIQLYRHPFDPFILGKTLLQEVNIYAPMEQLTINH